MKGFWSGASGLPLGKPDLQNRTGDHRQSDSRGSEDAHEAGASALFLAEAEGANIPDFERYQAARF
ncbi:MAG: hypothetical protein LBI14_07165, partial [Treponema sp.]|nr:hypothetical protein [Treponema sp.]